MAFQYLLCCNQCRQFRYLKHRDKLLSNHQPVDLELGSSSWSITSSKKIKHSNSSDFYNATNQKKLSFKFFFIKSFIRLSKTPFANFQSTRRKPKRKSNPQSLPEIVTAAATKPDPKCTQKQTLPTHINNHVHKNNSTNRIVLIHQ